MADPPFPTRHDERALAPATPNNRRHRHRNRQSRRHDGARPTESRQAEPTDGSLIGGRTIYRTWASATPSAGTQPLLPPQLHLRTRANLSGHVGERRPAQSERDSIAPATSVNPLSSVQSRRGQPEHVRMQQQPRSMPPSVNSSINTITSTAAPSYSSSESLPAILRPDSVFMALEKQEQRDYASTALNNWEKLAEWAQEQGCTISAAKDYFERLLADSSSASSQLDWKDEDGVEWSNRGDHSRGDRKRSLPHRSGHKKASSSSSTTSSPQHKNTVGSKKNASKSSASSEAITLSNTPSSGRI